MVWVNTDTPLIDIPDSPKPTFNKLSPEERRKIRQSNKVKRDSAASAEYTREAFNAANNISPIPAVFNPERRERCRYDLKLACQTYWPMKFDLGFSKDHIELLQILQKAILHNTGLAAFALPRGFGKSTIAECAAEWAVLNAHKWYIVLIQSTLGLARYAIDSILFDFETNDLLLQDFPEVCYPIRCIDRSWKRAIGQHVDQSPTNMQFRDERLILPTIEDSISSSSAIHALGITSSMRGLKHLRSDGSIIRPDFCLIDDPQTDKSAKSQSMTATRERIINGTIRGLAGPKKTITIIMPCTVIESGDLAERFLDQEKRPEWRGKRTSLLPSFPIHMDMWRKYADIRAEGLKAGMGQVDATEYYRNNQVAMDEGASVSWVDRFDPTIQISAIQAAMDLFYTDPESFASEYQNKPKPRIDAQANHELIIDANKMMDRLSGLPYSVAPRDNIIITSGIDIQGKILYYATVAWMENFGGHVIDYGTYPPQPTFDGLSAQEPFVVMGHDTPELTLGPKVYNGLEWLNENVFAKGFARDESSEIVYMAKCLIDANWHLSADAVYAFCKATQSTGERYIPSHGKGVTASMIPMEQWGKKIGEHRFSSIAKSLPASQQNNRGRHVIFDTNAWKSLVAERIVSHLSVPTALKLFGTSSYAHQEFCLHCAREKPTQKRGRFRTVNEWGAEQDIVENHWFDCLIMAAVAANAAGLQFHVRTEDEQGTKVSKPVQPKTRRIAAAI